MAWERGRLEKGRGEVTVGRALEFYGVHSGLNGHQNTGPIVAPVVNQAAASAVLGSMVLVASTLMQRSAVARACARLSAPMSVPSARTTRTSVMPKKPKIVFR